MAATKTFFLLFFLLLAVTLVAADDQQLMTSPYGGDDIESTLNPFYSYNLYALEVIGITNPGLGGVGDGTGGVGRDIVVTPRNEEVTVTSGALSSTEFTITNIGHSAARISVTTATSTSGVLAGRIYFDGQPSLSNVLIPSIDYENNYRVITLTVDTDELPDGEEIRTYIVDVLVETDTGEKEYHTLKLTTTTGDYSPPLLSILGNTVVESPVRVCDEGGFGRVSCTASNLVSRTGVAWWHLIVIAFFGCLFIFLIYRRKKKRAIIPIEEPDIIPVDEAKYVYSPPVEQYPRPPPRPRPRTPSARPRKDSFGRDGVVNQDDDEGFRF